MNNYLAIMSSPSHTPNPSLHSSHGGSEISLVKDAIKSQLYDFEKSLASSQLWAKQLADSQEAGIRAAAKETEVAATEVNKVLRGEKGSAATKEEPEGLGFKGVDCDLKHSSQSPSWQFPRLRSEQISSSPSRHRAKYKECDCRGCHRPGHGGGRSKERKVERSSKHQRSLSPSGSGKQERADGRSSKYKRRRSRSCSRERRIGSSHHHRSRSRERSRGERSSSKLQSQGQCRDETHSPRSGHLKHH